MKRTPVRRVSKKKASWLSKYRAAKIERAREQLATNGHLYCEITMENCHPEPHRPNGRVGANILDFKFITPELHRTIHANPKWARSMGYLK